MNNGILLTVIVPLAMFLMMLGLGTTLSTSALTKALRDKKVLGIGLLSRHHRRATATYTLKPHWVNI